MSAIFKALLVAGVLYGQVSSLSVKGRGVVLEDADAQFDRRYNHWQSSKTSTMTSSKTSTVKSSKTSHVPTATTTKTSSQSTTMATHTATATGPFWQPTAGTTWQIEISGVVSDTSFPADVFDVDLFDTPQSTIDTLHSLGKKVICYFSAGSYEDWRPDASQFVASDKGSPLDGWPGEWWLNTKSTNVRNIMAARIALAASKGCDGVDPDNVDGYDNDTGLTLTEQDAIDYLTFLAGVAHPLGLGIGLKNAGDIVGAMVPLLQWQVNEQCVQYNECDLFTPFITAGKPVFHIEYPKGAPNSVSANTQTKYCTNQSAAGFSSVLKDMNLDAWIYTC